VERYRLVEEVLALADRCGRALNAETVRRYIRRYLEDLDGVYEIGGRVCRPGHDDLYVHVDLLRLRMREHFKRGEIKEACKLSARCAHALLRADLARHLHLCGDFYTEKHRCNFKWLLDRFQKFITHNDHSHYYVCLEREDYEKFASLVASALAKRDQDGEPRLTEDDLPALFVIVVLESEEERALFARALYAAIARQLGYAEAFERTLEYMKTNTIMLGRLLEEIKTAERQPPTAPPPPPPPADGVPPRKPPRAAARGSGQK